MYSTQPNILKSVISNQYIAIFFEFFSKSFLHSNDSDNYFIFMISYYFIKNVLIHTNTYIYARTFCKISNNLIFLSSKTNASTRWNEWEKMTKGLNDKISKSQKISRRFENMIWISLQNKCSNYIQLQKDFFRSIWTFSYIGFNKIFRFFTISIPIGFFFFIFKFFLIWRSSIFFKIDWMKHAVFFKFKLRIIFKVMIRNVKEFNLNHANILFSSFKI